MVASANVFYHMFTFVKALVRVSVGVFSNDKHDNALAFFCQDTYNDQHNENIHHFTKRHKACKKLQRDHFKEMPLTFFPMSMGQFSLVIYYL